MLINTLQRVTKAALFFIFLANFNIAINLFNLISNTTCCKAIPKRIFYTYLHIILLTDFINKTILIKGHASPLACKIVGIPPLFAIIYIVEAKSFTITTHLTNVVIKLNKHTQLLHFLRLTRRTKFI